MSLKLITDRTSSDVNYAKSFRGKMWDDLSTTQKAEYLLGLKGAYSYTDFNRVENAVQYISDLLNMYGYSNKVNTKTNWTPEDMQTVREIQRYIDNIAELKNKYYSSVEGEMPTVFNWLTIEGANYIEKILFDIDRLIIFMSQNFIHSNVGSLGQNRTWQQRFRRISTWENLIYDLSKYNQEWNTVTYPATEIGGRDANSKDNISYTLNSWNDYMEKIDDLVGVIE